MTAHEDRHSCVFREESPPHLRPHECRRVDSPRNHHDGRETIGTDYLDYRGGLPTFTEKLKARCVIMDLWFFCNEDGAQSHSGGTLFVEVEDGRCCRGTGTSLQV